MADLSATEYTEGAKGREAPAEPLRPCILGFPVLSPFAGALRAVRACTYLPRECRDPGNKPARTAAAAAAGQLVALGNAAVVAGGGPPEPLGPS
jgi:hypothetical protein